MAETTKNNRSLACKLAEVMAAVKRIPKRGRNNFHGYDYVTEADLADAIRDELSQRNVILVPDVESYEMKDMPDTAKGKKQFLTTVCVRWTFMDGDSDATVSFRVPGYGIDGEDKGGYKAMTGAEKYALMKFFLVPTGDDPEEDEKQPQSTTRQQRPVSSRQPPPQNLGITEADTKQAMEPRRATPGNGKTVITEAQRKRMFTLASEHKWPEVELRNVLGRYGFERSNEVTSDKYDEICNLIQNRPERTA